MSQLGKCLKNANLQKKVFPENCFSVFMNGPLYLNSPKKFFKKEVIHNITVNVPENG